MGGKALKETIAEHGALRRLSKSEYFELYERVSEYLRALFNPRFFGTDTTRFALVPAYEEKPSFGDMDILYTEAPNGWREAFAEALKSKEVVRNGDVTSFECDLFQIDMIKTPSDHFDFALNYFSWNDFGNLIGRVAHHLGFKFGHNGLIYVYRIGDYAYREITVTTDFQRAMSFLGYNYDNNTRFKTLDEMFEYVTKSPHFHPMLFPLEHRSHTARMRDRKRPSYSAFLEWLQNEGYDLTGEVPEKVHSFHLNMALVEFHEFRNEYWKAKEDYENDVKFRERFNGDIVSEITGLTGKELGEFIQVFKKEMESVYKMPFKDLVLQEPEINLANEITRMQMK